jgi:hypothetical protein
VKGQEEEDQPSAMMYRGVDGTLCALVLSAALPLPSALPETAF